MENFLWNSVNSGFRFEDSVNETTNKLIKHVGRETIHVKQFPENLNLGVNVFIVGTKIKNGFPSVTFDPLVRRFLNNIFEPDPLFTLFCENCLYLPSFYWLTLPSNSHPDRQTSPRCLSPS